MLRKSLINSLNCFISEYFDVYQIHNISRAEEVEKFFGPDGIMEMIEAEKNGDESGTLDFRHIRRSKQFTQWICMILTH